MSARKLASAVLVALAALGSTLAAKALQEDPFTHQEHEGLFPLCTGCHEGIPIGDEALYFPQPQACRNCHDGVDLEAVEWDGRTEPIDNLRFVHVEHASEMEREGDDPLACRDCHVAPDGGRLSVEEEVRLDTCWSCHEHEATDHQVDAECATCHIPLAETAFPLSRIEDLPTPVDHDVGDFLLEGHGALADEGTARCATCHTQERCLSCHVDGNRAAIGEVPRAPSGMELPVAVARYDEPGSHLDEGWFGEHGGQASLETCGTCHTSNDCRSCHVASVPEAVETLVPLEASSAPGVVLEARLPESHESFFFLGVHGTLSAGDGSTCATCHQESFCVDCHDGPSNGGYHPTGFVARHTSAAAGRTAECATCHNQQAFCRACHQEAGLTGFDRLAADYHQGGPVWLLRHGQAARQNLESCASCHAQTECTTCHGTLGAFRVSPHPRDFDAERAFSKAPRTCAACHLTNPLIGR